MKLMIRNLVICTVLLFTLSCQQQEKKPAVTIWMDGYFEDWNEIQAAEFPHKPEQGLHVLRMAAMNDQNYLYVMVELSEEIIIQQANMLTLWIDTDGDASTGFSIGPMGADMSYAFGRREGKFYLQEELNNTPKRHASFGISHMPTHSSHCFEIRIPLNLTYKEHKLFQNDQIGLLFTADTALMPADIPANAIINYSLQDVYMENPAGSMLKEKPDDLRVLVYNVYWDGIFDRPEAFSRILPAVDADVILLLEMYKNGAEETLEWFNTYYPLPDNAQWYAYAHPGKVSLSRFPAKWSKVFDSDIYTLLDVPGWPEGVLVINMHLDCCDRNEQRQEKADAFIARFREKRDHPDGFNLAANTPVIIAGDFNLVGWQQQLTTLTHGEIVNQEKYGASFLPDWDHSPFATADAYHLTSREIYTWRDDIDVTDEFVPGRLDYCFYTSSVLKLGNHYVLWTPELPAYQLEKHGLKAEDTRQASDHLPLIVDFRLK
jgi:endonuclease/exonuclease/phosphatase family metal-dependent hydrolase